MLPIPRAYLAKDGRRIEFVAHGLPRRSEPLRSTPPWSRLSHGLKTRGQRHTEQGRAAVAAARCKRHWTYPHFERTRRWRLVVVGGSPGPLQSGTADFWRLLARHCVESTPVAFRPPVPAASRVDGKSCVRVCARDACVAGAGCRRSCESLGGFITS